MKKIILLISLVGIINFSFAQMAVFDAYANASLKTLHMQSQAMSGQLRILNEQTAKDLNNIYERLGKTQNLLNDAYTTSANNFMNTAQLKEYISNQKKLLVRTYYLIKKVRVSDNMIGKISFAKISKNFDSALEANDLSLEYLKSALDRNNKLTTTERMQILNTADNKLSESMSYINEAITEVNLYNSAIKQKENQETAYKLFQFK